MGLDVYVGTLTRYYTGDWQTIIQQSASEMGVSVTIARPEASPDPDAITDPAAIEEMVTEWRELLNASLKAHLDAPLDWAEGVAPPYFTDKPAWDCYSALIVWAAHAEHPGLPRPAVAPDDWSTDPAVQRSQAEGFASRYGQLLDGPELWLPGAFGFSFTAPDVSGKTVTVGSVDALLAQLGDLNARTWNASAADLSAWRRDGAESGAPLESSARFCLALLTELAQEAVTHRLPMKLDY